MSDTLPHAGAEYKERIVLPSRYRRTAIEAAHIAVGHMAANKTMRRLVERYVWPGLRCDVRQYVRGCPQCILHSRKAERAPAGTLPVPANPMEVIGIDFIGPFKPPDAAGNQYVLVVVDHLTCWLQAYPLPDQTAKSIIEIMTKHFGQYGYARVVINDRGQGLGSKAWTTFGAQLGIEIHRSSPVHPQSNGKTERANKTLKEILAKLFNNRPEQWADKLPAAVAAYNASVSSTTGYSPFYLLFGRTARVPMDRYLPSVENPYFGNRLDDLAAAHRHNNNNNKTTLKD